MDLLEVLPAGLLLYWVLSIGVISLLAATFHCGGHRYAVFRRLLQHGKTLPPRKNGGSSFVAGLSTLTVPKRWFLHFYVVGLVWQALLWWLVLDSLLTTADARRPPLLRAMLHEEAAASRSAPPASAAASGDDDGFGSDVQQELIDSFLCMVAFSAHLVRRLYECVFVHDRSSPAIMHVAHYVFGPRCLQNSNPHRRTHAHPCAESCGCWGFRACCPPTPP